MTPADVLDAAGQAQRELNVIDDQIGDAITMIEAGLRQHIATRISIDVTGETFTRLAFGKVNGAWRLILDEQPLNNASREQRARALAGGHVMHLIANAANIITAQVAGRKAATEAANAVLCLLDTMESAARWREEHEG